MTLEIISAERVLFSGETDMVSLPGEMGNFTVLNNHASLISTLLAGKVEYKTNDGILQSIEVKGGLVDVDNNVVSVCIY